MTDIVEVRLFAELTTQGLGIGECSAVAVALNRGIRIAIDDKRAIKKISRLGYKLDTISTSELTVCLIKAAILTVEVADNFKKIWKLNIDSSSIQQFSPNLSGQRRRNSPFLPTLLKELELAGSLDLTGKRMGLLQELLCIGPHDAAC